MFFFNYIIFIHVIITFLDTKYLKNYSAFNTEKKVSNTGCPKKRYPDFEINNPKRLKTPLKFLVDE